jgi:hypothetical protein
LEDLVLWGGQYCRQSTSSRLLHFLREARWKQAAGNIARPTLFFFLVLASKIDVG